MALGLCQECVWGLERRAREEGNKQRELRVLENPPFLMETCKRMATCRVPPPEHFIFQFIFGGEGVSLSLIHGNIPNSLTLLPSSDVLDEKALMAHRFLLD